MTHTVSHTDARFSRPTRLQVQIFSAVVLVVLADWLFYDQAVGVTFACFLSLAAAAVKLTSPEAISRRTAVKGAAVFALSVLPSLEAFTFLAMALGLAGIIVFTLLVNRKFRCGIAGSLRIVVLFVTLSPFRLMSDAVRIGRVHRHERSRNRTRPGIIAWVVPILFSAVFLGLFASANPIIADWVTAFSPADALDTFDLVRTLFWALMLLVCWPFLRVRLPNLPTVKKPAPASGAQPASLPPRTLFGEAAVLRGLVAFNLLFAVQTALDATYLWAGAHLPDGMTYAAYAQRGAYPLLIAALLSAVFVLAALRPGSALEKSRLIRSLVFVWIAQNIVLMISALLRLTAYVEIYSLTYWRLAAFLWMVLVAAGLTLILLRIFLCRSNAWLVGGNIAAALVVVYGASITNLPRIIAMYNVKNSLEISHTGPRLDIAYIRHLGPQAIPALDLFLDGIAGSGTEPNLATFMSGQRDSLKRLHDAMSANWRLWSFRQMRLQWYLDRRANAVLSSAKEYDRFSGNSTGAAP